MKKSSRKNVRFQDNRKAHVILFSTLNAGRSDETISDLLTRVDSGISVPSMRVEAMKLDAGHYPPTELDISVPSMRVEAMKPNAWHVRPDIDGISVPSMRVEAMKP